MVDVEEVKDVAENARIELKEDEAQQFAEEFDNILEMFRKLEDVNTDDVEPAFHPTETEPETRSDEKEETLDRDEVFANTDNEEDGFFKGPSV